MSATGAGGFEVLRNSKLQMTPSKFQFKTTKDPTCILPIPEVGGGFWIYCSKFSRNSYINLCNTCEKVRLEDVDLGTRASTHQLLRTGFGSIFLHLSSPAISVTDQQSTARELAIHCQQSHHGGCCLRRCYLPQGVWQEVISWHGHRDFGGRQRWRRRFVPDQV